MEKIIQEENIICAPYIFSQQKAIALELEG